MLSFIRSNNLKRPSKAISIYTTLFIDTHNGFTWTSFQLFTCGNLYSSSSNQIGLFISSLQGEIHSCGDRLEQQYSHTVVLPSKRNESLFENQGYCHDYLHTIKIGSFDPLVCLCSECASKTNTHRYILL